MKKFRFVAVLLMLCCLFVGVSCEDASSNTPSTPDVPGTDVPLDPNVPSTSEWKTMTDEDKNNILYYAGFEPVTFNSVTNNSTGDMTYTIKNGTVSTPDKIIRNLKGTLRIVSNTENGIAYDVVNGTLENNNPTEKIELIDFKYPTNKQPEFISGSVKIGDTNITNVYEVLNIIDVTYNESTVANGTVSSSMIIKDADARNSAGTSGKMSAEMFVTNTCKDNIADLKYSANISVTVDGVKHTITYSLELSGDMNQANPSKVVVKYASFDNKYFTPESIHSEILDLMISSAT